MKKLVILIGFILAACSANPDAGTQLSQTESLVVPEGTEVDWSADCQWPEPANAYQVSGSWITDSENVVDNATMDLDPSQNCAVTVRTSNDWGIANETVNCFAHVPEISPMTEGAEPETRRVPFTCQNGDTQVSGLGTETTSAFHVCQQQSVTITSAQLVPGQTGHVSAMVQDPETLTGYAIFTGFDATGVPGIMSNGNASAVYSWDLAQCSTESFKWSVPFEADYQCGPGGSFWMMVQIFDNTPNIRGCRDQSAQFYITCL